MVQKLVLVLLFSVGASVAIPLLIGGKPTIEHLASLPLHFLITLLFILLLTWCLNAARSYLLLKRYADGLTFGKALTIIMACDFCVKSTPAGTGGPVAAITLLKRVSVNPPRTISAFALVHSLDLCLVILLICGIVFLNFQHWIESEMTTGLFVFIGLLILLLSLLIIIVQNHRQLIIQAGRILRRFKIGRRLSFPLARQILLIRAGLADSFALPLYTRGLIISFSVIFWLAQTSMLFLALVSLGADIAWEQAALAQLMGMGAGRALLLPGGAGGIELTGAGILSLWLDPALAAAGILAWRGITLYPSILLGGITMLVITLRTQKN